MPIMRLLRHWRQLLGLTIAFLLLLAPMPASGQTKADVDRTKQALDDATAKLQEVTAQLEDAVARYQAVNSELEDLTWRISGLYSRIQDYEYQVGALRDTARDLVLEAYMGGGADLISVAFEAGSLQDLITTQELLTRATENDVITLDRLEAVKREMDRLKEELQVDQDRVTELRAEAEILVEEVETLYEAADAEYSKAKAANATAVAKFEEEQRKKRLLELARKQGAAAGASAGAVAGFVCPLPGGRFINDWGFPRSGGRTHKGTDVFAPKGTPLLAVADGVVTLRSSSLGGVTVYLTANNGTLYYYAHLNGYGPGMSSGVRVSAGQVVGYVGNSGNAISTPPHLHFEIHPNGGAAVNPYPTLSRAC